jgi:hypothetical protein
METVMNRGSPPAQSHRGIGTFTGTGTVNFEGETGKVLELHDFRGVAVFRSKLRERVVER